MQPKPFPNHKITATGENLSRGVHFLRSLLGRIRRAVEWDVRTIVLDVPSGAVFADAEGTKS
jgi:hypothetical protein